MRSCFWKGYFNTVCLNGNPCILCGTVLKSAGLEHPPTYTVGKRGEMYDDTVEEYLREKGADFHRVNRGGLITFHGPGQLVGYPILRLERRGYTRWYVETLEAAIIDLLAEFGLKGERNPHTGVWIGQTIVYHFLLMFYKYSNCLFDKLL